MSHRCVVPFLLLATLVVTARSSSGAEFVPISLVCIETEDTAKADDVYLKAGSKVIWGPKQMNDGDALKIVLANKVTFSGEVEIALYDKDVPDGDDLLGNLTVYAAASGSRDLTHAFTNDGAHYVLTYRVRQ